MLTRAIEEEDASPGLCQPCLFAERALHGLKGAFARSIRCRRNERRPVFDAEAPVPIVFGARSRRDDAFPSTERKLLEQVKAGLDPPKIFLRGPEPAWLGIPCEVEQMTGLKLCE